MNFNRIIFYLTGLFLAAIIVYISACESKTGITDPIPPPDPMPNPYGEGNGKITFFRTQQIAGNVIINIASKQINDTIVWQATPNCDTNIAASQILKAGNYSVRITGNSFLCDYKVNVEEKKCVLLNYTNCTGGNPYGEGNGKVTFYRIQHIEGPVTIKVSDKILNDSTVWQTTPDCNNILAVSAILKAGDYSIRIEGKVFLCNYTVRIEEKICKLVNYTNCNGGTVGCYTLTGTWLRTADGPCPNCMGLKVQFIDGFGEVIYTPPGCRFPLGDIKWKDFNIDNCTIHDLARDEYGGSPEYQTSSVTFFHKDSLLINGPSGMIPYSRISYSDKIKTIKNITYSADSSAFIFPDRLQVGQ